MSSVCVFCVSLLLHIQTELSTAHLPDPQVSGVPRGPSRGGDAWGCLGMLGDARGCFGGGRSGRSGRSGMFMV